MTTTWTIEKLICKPSENGLNNVVYQVHWKYTKSTTVGDETYSKYNNGILIIPSPDPQSFTSYESLTKTQVVGWIQTTLGQEYITDMDMRVTNALTDETTQVILELPFEN